jgi:3-phenylpropionate/trans-cinnamate dioxygenase ferredoxin subunit
MGSSNPMDANVTAIPFSPVAPAADIPVGSAKCLDINGRSVLVAHLPDGFHAVENRCSHAASPLDCRRILKGGQVLCPLHGARFDLRTGAAKTAPAFRPIPVYAVRVSDGTVEVAVPAKPAPATVPRPFGAELP